MKKAKKLSDKKIIAALRAEVAKLKATATLAKTHADDIDALLKKATKHGNWNAIGSFLLGD